VVVDLISGVAPKALDDLQLRGDPQPRGVSSLAGGLQVGGDYQLRTGPSA
jgi:hypothetical protein